MTETQTVSLRERTRRAVHDELVAVAQRLILEQGYDEVTVERIAEAAGLSKRSFFRYFPTKDAVLLGQFDHFATTVRRALEDRPDSEPVWSSLRRMFDPVAADVETRSDDAHALQGIIESTPSLNGGYLAALDRMQTEVAAAIAERAKTEGLDTLETRALVGSAFACLHAALSAHRRDSASDLGELVDRAMTAVRA